MRFLEGEALEDELFSFESDHLFLFFHSIN